MTIQDLKTNRNEIIKAIKAVFGEDKLNSVMSMMADTVTINGSSYSSWEDIMEEIESMDLYSNRKMRTADYIASLNNHESFDMKKYYANKN